MFDRAISSCVRTPLDDPDRYIHFTLMNMQTSKHSRSANEHLTIWPHRSLSPKGFGIVMGALGLLTFIIGLGFFLAGAWPVIGFLGLELLVVWGAFKLNYRAARRRETLKTEADDLIIHRTDPSGKVDTERLSTAWLRVQLTPKDAPSTAQRYRQRVILTSHGKSTEIGSFLHPAEKKHLATELSSMIGKARERRLNDA